ncbi:MAG: hypothetical protein R3D25_13445 [Geminicoccaceae bacterium]
MGAEREIARQKNPHYQGGEVPFERVVIRHIGDSAPPSSWRFSRTATSTRRST